MNPISIFRMHDENYEKTAFKNSSGKSKINVHARAVVLRASAMTEHAQNRRVSPQESMKQNRKKIGLKNSLGKSEIESVHT
jgi:hypothetical protein